MARKWVWAILPALLLAGCGSPRGPLKPVSLVLDWYPNAVHSFIYAAREQGYFREEGLQVEIKMPAENPTDGIRLVGARQETFALYYQPDVLLARGEGIPVVSVAAIVRHPLNGIMAPAAGGIRTPADLEGKRIGYPGIPLNVPMVRTMVRTAGGDPDRVVMTDVSWDLVPAIATGKVEALAGGFRNHELLLLERQGIPMLYFSPADFGVPNYYELVLVTAETAVAQDREMVAAFVRALGKGYRWMKEHPDAALELILKRQNESFPLEAEVEQQSLEILLGLMEDPGMPFGSQKQEDWEQVAAWMAAQGVLDPGVQPAAAFANMAP